MNHILKNKFYKIAAFVIVVFILVLVFHLYNITSKKICDLPDLMDGCLTFSSIATALLFGSFSVVFTKSSSKFNKNMKDIGLDLDLMRILLLSSFIFFIISILSIIGLVINSFINEIPNTVFQIFSSLWILTIICGIFNIFHVFLIVIRMIKIMYDYRYSD